MKWLFWKHVDIHIMKEAEKKNKGCIWKRKKKSLGRLSNGCLLRLKGAESKNEQIFRINLVHKFEFEI